MSELITKVQLPPIPAKRYFTIGEVSELFGVKPHVLRYWEQEFTQLKPVKRRGNRRYYQHHEVLLIRRIRELLYDEGFTINGARNRLDIPASKADNNQLSIEGAISGSDGKANEVASDNVQFDFNLVKTELTEVLSLLRPVLQSS